MTEVITTTSVDLIPSTESKYETKDLDLHKMISDLSLPLEDRINAINLYYSQEGDDIIETINKLSMMYELSGTKYIRQYLYAICEKTNISPLLKSISAKALCSHDVNDDLGYKAIDLIYSQMGPDIGTPYKIEFIKMLMNNDFYKKKARDHLCNTINDTSINGDYRFKTILSLEYRPEPISEEIKKDKSKLEKIKNSNEKNTKKMNYFIQEACLEFIKNEKNMISYRILAGQNLLKKPNPSQNLEGVLELPPSDTSSTRDSVASVATSKDTSLVENILLSFAQNTSIEYNLRADATDVLLQLGSPEIKLVAQEIIMELGRTERGIKTLYNNAQNVHTKEVEDSVKEALEFLQSFEVKKKLTFSIVEGEILKLLEDSNLDKDKHEKIIVALNRIAMDRALYSRYNCSLAHILLQVWTYITGHKCESQMKERLLEELSDMSGTCSSGFASRLINTISGFGDFNVRISWRDQITANFSGRLNARIRDMDDLNLQEKVMEQMTVESPNYEDRKHFLKFLRKSIPVIRQELHTEFKEHISETDFDLYFRSALSLYETGQIMA